MTPEATDPVSPKTSEEALAFVRSLQKAFPKTPRTKKELAALRKYLARFSDAELKAVGRRVLSDLMQRPPRTINEGDLPPTSPSSPRDKVVPDRKRGAAKPPRARRRARRS